MMMFGFLQVSPDPMEVDASPFRAWSGGGAGGGGLDEVLSATSLFGEFEVVLSLEDKGFEARRSPGNGAWSQAGLLLKGMAGR